MPQGLSGDVAGPVTAPPAPTPELAPAGRTGFLGEPATVITLISVVTGLTALLFALFATDVWAAAGE